MGDDAGRWRHPSRIVASPIPIFWTTPAPMQTLVRDLLVSVVVRVLVPPDPQPWGAIVVMSLALLDLHVYLLARGRHFPSNRVQRSAARMLA